VKLYTNTYFVILDTAAICAKETLVVAVLWLEAFSFLA